MIKPNTNFQVDVTPNQVNSFNDNGYLSIDRITTDEEIEWLKQIYNKLFQERVGEEQGQYFHRYLVLKANFRNCVKPYFLKTLTH